MIKVKKVAIFIVLIAFVLILLPLATDVKPITELNELSTQYVEKGLNDLKASNIVTAIIVTFRGLDTIGEVAVLFLATVGVGFLLRRREDEEAVVKTVKRESSEFLQTGANFLIPLIFLFGTYIFAHGHLTPGGGFQGGVVIASGVLLLMLAEVSFHLNEFILHFVESLSGVAVVVLGVLGVVYLGADHFLDNRLLPLGELGKLFSAGIMPIVYSLIGLKVGTELTSILENMSEDQ